MLKRMILPFSRLFDGAGVTRSGYLN